MPFIPLFHRSSANSLTAPYPSVTIAPSLTSGVLPVITNRLIFATLAVLTGCTSLSAHNELAGVLPNGQDPQAATFAPAREPIAIAALAVEPAITVAETSARPAVSATHNVKSTSNEPIARSSQNDLWQRIRGGFAMQDSASLLVARHQQWYVSRPDYVARMTERAERYLHFIVEEVEKRGMPMEIALLPMIESAFNPGAYSGARASGIWQFIPSTGKNFGMQQNWWYDGRRDVITATTGALDYLQKLHDEFGDWELALAAYNCGENAVRRAQDRNRKLHRPTDYGSLKLPRETRNYVPKLLAVKNIVSAPARFGLTLQPIANQPYFAPVVTARHIDVKLAAELADISLDEFIALNPANNRPVILQENADVLLLPVGKVETFQANLERYNEPLVTWQAYQSKKGERLDKLAELYGLSVEQLRSINGLPPHAKVSTGQALLVPRISDSAENEFEVFNTHLVPFDQLLSNAIRHTVRKGDTLSAIARRYHVRLSSLQSWNKGVKILRPGQKIYVVKPAKTVRMAKTAPTSKKSRRLVQKEKSDV